MKQLFIAPAPHCALAVRMLVGRLLAGGAVALLAAGACAAGPYNPDHLQADAIGRVSSICSNVMGLSPGEEHFDNCVESLSDSQASLGQGRALAGAQGECRSRGLPPGSPDLAECELRLSEQSAAAPAPFTPARTSDPVSRRSYFLTAPRDVHGREELSCARLGLEPGGGAFQGCVANLQSVLFSADIPAQ